MDTAFVRLGLRLALIACLCQVALQIPSDCNENDDCGNAAYCCLRTPPIKRLVDLNYKRNAHLDLTFHHCERFLDENSTYCHLHSSIVHNSTSYYGFLCPCAPGLICEPSNDLNENRFPPSYYGKCKSAIQ